MPNYQVPGYPHRDLYCHYLQTESSDESDEATKTIKMATTEGGSMEVHQSGPPEYEVTIDDILQTAERLVHQSEAESFLLTK